MIRGPKKVVSVLMPMDLYDQLSQLAQETHRTLPGCIRQILKAYLRRQREDNAEDWWLIH